MSKGQTIATEESIVRTSFRMPKSLHRELKQFCLDAERTEAEVINSSITEYIRLHRKGK